MLIPKGKQKLEKLMLKTGIPKVIIYVVIKPNEAEHPPKGSSDSVINIYGTNDGTNDFDGDGSWSVTGPGFRLRRGRR